MQDEVGFNAGEQRKQIIDNAGFDVSDTGQGSVPGQIGQNRIKYSEIDENRKFSQL